MKLSKQRNSLLSGLALIIGSLSCPASAQEVYSEKTYPTADFRPPLDIAPSLSGSFGELRGNHFHSGMDFRTNQREGYPVYAVADGYVSRLRVQVGGFGNAVYLSHPNGYTTVYAHLQRFNEQISRVVKAYQYRKESFDVDFPLLPIEIPVKKGDIIAWSGNTGSSGGPHLHFEVRDSRTEEIINPQLFGLKAPDNIKPGISGLYMYRLNGKPFSEHTPRQYFQLSGGNGNYSLNKNPVITFNGEVGFGIITDDRQPAGNKNGVYSIELQMDGKTIFLSAMERFSFANSRALNSHVDYPSLRLYGRSIQKSFVDPGNPLKIYKALENRGLISVTDDKVHQMKYIVKDVSGNTSTLSFRIRYSPQSVIKAPQPAFVKQFAYADSNQYTAANALIKIPKGVLYNDLYFEYKELPRKTNAWSVTHRVHNRLTPLHDGYELWLRADSLMPAHLHSKALIMDTRGASHGGQFEKGFVKANPRVFGDFYITTDTIPPVIRSVNVSDNQSLKGIKKLVFRISDERSGIRSFRGTIDGQWVLMEYDPKTRTLWHTLEDSLQAGKHHFQLMVNDMKNNAATFNATLYK